MDRIFCERLKACRVAAGYLIDRIPPRRVDVCPCCGAKLESQKRVKCENRPR